MNMPQDEHLKPPKSQSQPKPSQSPWLTTPKPIKRLFDKFPLLTYPTNQLPIRNPIDRSRHTLYIFARDEDALNGSPSFNPSCLKWQTYLLFAGIPFATKPSSNHASPTGSLPFLIPASSTSNPDPPAPSASAPISSAKLQEWAVAQHSGDRTSATAITTPSSKTTQQSNHSRHEAYLSLLDNPIRNAWLHTLYLTPANLSAVAHPLYIAPSTSWLPARFSLAHTLRAAALEELVKAAGAPVVDADALYRASDAAFAALAQLLGADEWFFGEEKPGVMDAGVFAYTHLLVDEEGMMGWKEGGGERMRKALRDGRCRNLVEHRRRIWERWYCS